MSNIQPIQESESQNPEGCICQQPLLQHIPAGQQLQCAQHPEHIIYGSEVVGRVIFYYE